MRKRFRRKFWVPKRGINLSGAEGGNKKTPCARQGATLIVKRMQLSQSLISQISLPELAPYENDHFRVHRCRLPGFTGPIPSTSLDKAIQLLDADYRFVKWVSRGL